VKIPIIFLLFVPVSLQCLGGGDSVDVWHVKYNDSLVAELTEAKPVLITEKLIKPGDSLSVLYLRDQQCETCLTDLLIADAKEEHLKLIDRYPTREPISISLSDLKKYAASKKSKYFRFYYWERPGRLQDNSLNAPVRRRFIFSLHLK
jgi:hypothetical protein